MLSGSIYPLIFKNFNCFSTDFHKLTTDFHKLLVPICDAFVRICGQFLIHRFSQITQIFTDDLYQFVTHPCKSVDK